MKIVPKAKKKEGKEVNDGKKRMSVAMQGGGAHGDPFPDPAASGRAGTLHGPRLFSDDPIDLPQGEKSPRQAVFGLSPIEFLAFRRAFGNARGEGLCGGAGGDRKIFRSQCCAGGYRPRSVGVS